MKFSAAVPIRADRLDGVVHTIKVDDGGLHLLADQCDTAAVSMIGTAAPPVAGPPFQVTAAAVSRGYTQLEVAAAALAARATATGTKLRTASTSYTATDDGSAAQIAAAGRSVEV